MQENPPLQRDHKAEASPALLAFVHDAQRFILNNASIIGVAPLQVSWCAKLWGSLRKSRRLPLIFTTFSILRFTWRNLYWKEALERALSIESKSMRMQRFPMIGKANPSVNDFYGRLRVLDRLNLPTQIP